MVTIVETLNIGFVIPLIDMECELNLSLSQKGILNSAAFVGQFDSAFAGSSTITQFYFLRRREQLTFLGFPRRLGPRRTAKGDAFLRIFCLRLLGGLIFFRPRLDAHCDAILRRLFVSF